MFQNRDKINPPSSSKARSRSKTPERKKKHKKREKSPKRRKRTRSRSRSPIVKEKRMTRSEKRRDDLKRKIENDNLKVTLNNDKASSDDILLDIAIDSKSAVKLQEKLAKKKEMMIKRKEEKERKQKEKDEKRSVAHIVGSSSRHRGLCFSSFQTYLLTK